MASFRFNFSGDNKSEETFDSENEEEIEWLNSEEVYVGDQKRYLEEIAAHARMFTCGDVKIGHVATKETILKMGNKGLKNAISLAEEEHSDLVKAKYEGGLKIWECTYDLIDYFVFIQNVNFNHLKVLDVGCGAGILGIYALMNGADVVFQDYNKEVLECVTIPNVLINIDEMDGTNDIILNKCKFYSGDWDSFNGILPATFMFDIILASEIIYNPDNYQKIVNIILQRLKKDGTVYVAAKTCYFGVGGGTREFEECLCKHPFLKSEICWKSSGGIQREIIKITRNKELFLLD